MNMFIYPKYLEDTTKTGWIVKFLRILGVLQVSGCIILGATLGRPFVAASLVQAGIMSMDAANASGALIGLAVGIVVGLWTSLPFFALAQVIDDLHAIRTQTAAYVAFETDKPRLGHD